LKDLKWVYYACFGLPYGKEDKTLLIDNEPTKVLWNPKWSGVFFWIIKGTNVVKEQGAMVGPCITIVATVVWIALSKDNSNSLWPYGQIF
jgi:hypothetical protein